MDALQVKMVVLRFDVFLLESDTFEAVIEQRGLLCQRRCAGYLPAPKGSVVEFFSVMPICHPWIRDCGNQGNLASIEQLFFGAISRAVVQRSHDVMASD